MEQEQGWDPDVKKYFLKILSTITYGLLWLIVIVWAGIYHKMGWQEERSLVVVILFYAAAIVSLFFLLRYFYRLWKK